jgi:asparagine synthase (glutamine-hydrolysing)
MCGIFGGNRSLLMTNTSSLLAHRGPDQSNVVAVDGKDFLFGMNRLSIVDRRDMQIPFEGGGASIIFNGEIYNWRDIRKDLEKHGIRFHTNTDTEVALHAYLVWGPACLERFNGMFALAIWNKGQLFLARDRMGKKPLFYYYVPTEGLAFSSELKAFANLEHAPIEICERLEFYFNEHTPYENVHSLKPGEYMLYDCTDRTFSLQPWYSFPKYAGDIDDLDDALDVFLPLFEDACQIRQIADRPVTIFLSGGIDSALIQTVLRFNDTYTIQFDEFKDQINEEDLVSEFASFLGFRTHIIRPTKQQFNEYLPTLARHIEFPVGSFSVFPLYCLAKEARKDGYVVALSGEGSDEFFNGYYRNEILLEEDDRIQVHVTGAYRDLSRRYFGPPIQRLARMASRGGEADVPLLVDFFSSYWDEKAPFSYNISKIEASVFLQPLLIMSDRMSMASSLEVRNPFMDHRIVDFSCHLAPNLKWAQGKGKLLIHRALQKLLGNQNLGLLNRQYKHGLPSPVNQWLFSQKNFDRKEWNAIILGECLRQMSLRSN